MKIRALAPNVFRMDTEMFNVRNKIHFRLPWRFWDKIDTLWNKLLNWLFRRYDLIRIKSLPRSQYYDLDVRMLHANFQLLVDYVEKELAWLNYITTGKYRWYHRWLPVRDPEAGLAHLDWEIQLGEDSPFQSRAAEKIKGLYHWWTVDRPQRVDPWQVIEDSNEAMRAEERHEKEDTMMLFKLVSVRNSMWT